MCGITIYKGVPSQILDVWNSMLQIKHRGEEDGFGYIDLGNKNEIVKSLLTLDEIKEGKLDETRKLKKPTKLKLTKRIIEIKKGLYKTTDFIVLHNRKASYGGVSVENTHPIKLSDSIYYVHNGSTDADLIKRYLTIVNKVKFNTQTDSEFLGWFVEKELAEGIKPLDIFNKLSKLCPYGFGVLVRIDLLNKEVTIFKDTDRTLYLYNNLQSLLLISEPIETLRQFEECYRIDKGVIKIKDTIDLDLCKLTNITDRLNVALKKEGYDYTCDYCKSKGITRRLFNCKDFCLVCATSNLNLEKLDKEIVKTYTEAGNEIYDANYWATKSTFIDLTKKDSHDDYNISMR